MPNSTKRQLTPQQRIRQLVKQLADEKLKTEFVEDVIYHLEKECGTNPQKSMPSTCQDWKSKRRVSVTRLYQ